jgi:hypothetical protein
MLATSAAAETAFLFDAQNTSTLALTIYVDGKPACHAAPGKSCRVLYTDVDSPLSYSLGKGAPVSFDPGDIDIVSRCTFDGTTVRCVDSEGISTQ